MLPYLLANFVIWPNKKKVWLSHPNVPNYLPPTLNFFSPNFEVEKKYQKRMYQNAHLNENFTMYIHSLVLEIEGLFYISFDLLNTFRSRSIRSKKEKKVF